VVVSRTVINATLLPIYTFVPTCTITDAYPPVVRPVIVFITVGLPFEESVTVMVLSALLTVSTWFPIEMIEVCVAFNAVLIKSSGMSILVCEKIIWGLFA